MADPVRNRLPEYEVKKKSSMRDFLFKPRSRAELGEGIPRAAPPDEPENAEVQCIASR